MIKDYRKRSSFNSQGLEEVIDSKEIVDLKNTIFSVIEQDPLFHKADTTPCLDVRRKLAQLQSRRLIDYGLIDDSLTYKAPLYMCLFLRSVAQYDLSVLFKTVITKYFFGVTIRSLGSSEQQQYYENANSEKLSGCFALTEIGHGTDARRVRTTATYDEQTGQFVLHTPDFLAAKCWSGNMGQTATHAVIFAQLITADRQNHGFHGFIAPIRDPNSLLPFPGVTVGDMGEKIGLAGMDNGFCVFNQYRIPRENLLSKYCSVTDDGEYVSVIKDSRKRFALSLGSLIMGRTMVLNVCVGLMTNALTIAIRYSAVRKQFGPTDDQELSVIEYPLQQWRLFPFLAALFAMKSASNLVNATAIIVGQKMWDQQQLLPDQDMLDTLSELHPLMSALKAAFSWTSQAAIQQCREACGGHGYLQCAGLGHLRNDNDGNSTYEGDNNVLQQQASNWLMRLWKQRGSVAPLLPLHSADFLYRARPNKMVARSDHDLCKPPVILETYQWLVCWLAEKAVRDYQKQVEQGKDNFTARNHSQLYSATSLAIAYGEHFLLQSFWELCCRADQHSLEAQAVLTQLCSLFGLSSLDKHLVYLHQGCYIDTEQSQLIQSAILSLCERLKNEVISLVDVIAPPDFILNSVLGDSKGDVYRKLEQALITNTGNLQRPDWWLELSSKFRSRL